MQNRTHRIVIFALPLLAIPAGVIRYNAVGKYPDGSILIPTGQLLRPAGALITVNDSPLGMALSPDGLTLAVTTGSNFNPPARHLIDVAGKALIETMLLKDGFVGIAFHHAGDSIYVGGNGNDDVPALKRRVGRLFEAATSIGLPSGSAPRGWP